MGTGHRHRPRGRGHEGRALPSDHERILVLPGDEIAGRGLQPGPGTYRVSGRIYASVLGLVQHRPPSVRVVPLSGRYIPRAGDVVVGTVADVQGTFWLLDIGAPRWAPLHMTGTSFPVDVGETGKYLRVGDAVVVAVERLEATGRIGVTLNGEGLGKLDGGTIHTVSPARVPRVIGRGGSMIQTLTGHTGTRLVVGQNGRIWIDGSDDGIRRVTECLRLIDEEGQRAGLTERIASLLTATEAPGGRAGSIDADRPPPEGDAPPREPSEDGPSGELE